MGSDPRITRLIKAWVLITGWLVALSMFNLLKGADIAGVALPLSLLPIAAIIAVTVMPGKDPLAGKQEISTLDQYFE